MRESDRRNLIIPTLRRNLNLENQERDLQLALAFDFCPDISMRCARSTMEAGLLNPLYTPVESRGKIHTD